MLFLDFQAVQEHFLERVRDSHPGRDVRHRSRSDTLLPGRVRGKEEGRHIDNVFLAFVGDHFTKQNESLSFG